MINGDLGAMQDLGYLVLETHKYLKISDHKIDQRNGKVEKCKFFMDPPQLQEYQI